MIESRPGDAFQPGDLLNNTYRIESILGRGGTSDVYRARNEINGRLMALKVLRAEFASNEDFMVLLTREEEIREVRHDAVVRYSENGRTHDGHVYLLMDYVEGPGLDAKLKAGPMSADDLLIVARRVAEGLAAAHARRIVHRDLSPDNIILAGGDPAQAIIIDFGIAKDTNPGAQTIVGNEFAGKYAYAAPEQLNGQTDARTDIYSLGALLLANFRGQSPKVGRNPMEVVENKGKPLDTEGVPEPLKTLIDRMTAPDPDLRMQTCADVLAFLDAPEVGPVAPEDDATIIVPPPKPSTPTPERDPDILTPQTIAPPSIPDAGSEPRSRAGLMALLAALVVGGGAGGAYVSGALDGLIGTGLPPADPFTLTLTRPAEGPSTGEGFIPSEAMRQALAERFDTLNVTLASGDIAESWGDDVLSAVDGLKVLDNWNLTLTGNSGSASGKTSERDVQSTVQATFANGLPGALSGPVEVAFEPLFLPTADVAGLLSQFQDCGPLEQPQAGPAGYGPQSQIVVKGRVAETATRVQLFDKLRALGGERQVVLDLDVLNPTLCTIEAFLPEAPESGIEVQYSMGETGAANPSGRFFPGENPVIDIVLPPDVADGFLTVSILDVSGSVFHLLPKLNREDNSVAALRGGQSGTVPVRVAFPVEEASKDAALVGFTVDDSSFGKSKIIVLHSSAPLFDGLRPVSESAASYAEALQDHFEDDSASILSLDSSVFETVQP